MNNRDIAKVGFAVLAAVMSYNFADTIVHAEETSVEPVKETAPVENQDKLTDVIDAVVEDTNVPENTEETDVPKEDEETTVPEKTEDENETTTVGGGSETSAKLTDGWSSDSLQYVKDGAYVTNSFAEIDGQKYYFDENGNKVTGFKTIGTNSYYFNESGMMQTGLQVLHDQETGIAVYSLRKEDGKLHYYLENGAAYSGMINLDGKIYYFDNGVQSVGEKQANGYWYNFKEDGSLSVGFVNMGNSAKYYDNLGRRQTGTFKIDKVTYNTDSNGFITKASWEGVSYYCQNDGRWAWDVVGNYYFGGSGCVPTTVTMIVNTINGTNYTPNQVGQILHNAGYFNTSSIGTGGDSWQFVANKFGLSYKSNLNVESAKQELLKGNMIAAAVGGGKFCPWYGVTHEILLFGLDAQGYTTVYDPYTSSRNGRVHISEVFNHPSWDSGDKKNGGPFFSLGKLRDQNLYLDVSKGNAHVGKVYYTGKNVEPEVNLSMKNTALVQGRDYKVVYSNNVNLGKGTAMIIGINAFTGKLMVSFDIIKDEMSNGTYEIISSLNSNKVLDIKDGSKASGAHAQIYSWNGTQAQRFEIHKNQNGYYTIKNTGSNLYVGISTNWNTMGNYNSLIQGVNASSKAAQFIFTRNSNGQWIISSAWDSRYVFDLNGANLDNGNKVQIYTQNGTSAQAWKLLKVSNSREKIDDLAQKNKNTLTDGTYTINSTLNTSYVLDVNGGSKVNFGNIQLYQSNGTLAQGWKVSHDSKGYVTFINIGSGKAIDVKDGSACNGQNISQYTSNNTYAQKWIVVQEGNGFKIISALNTSYVLDLNSALVKNYQNIQTYKSNDTLAQRWYFSTYVSPREKLDTMAKEYNADITEATYVISNYVNPNYVLDIKDGSKANRGNLQIYKSNNTNAQKWQLKKDSVGYITFINVGSNKALDVSNATVRNGSNIWQYESNGTYAQKWIAKKNTDGSLTFVSALDANYVLDINAGKVINWQNIQLYKSNGTNAQKFKLTKI
ncbi:RICIN domain-containing protein [Holdemanella hominis]|uniref:RICIN domain-containing protein n=1 Tax=Holdemanella hominis TaxID=2764327 RepID=A0ABR7KJV5_9FIRM|nr:RICIN domain-containing protein [Holdemanella hominis]MBC6012947.1 RICIN domain-containing protein [Holdemanella hominis]